MSDLRDLRLKVTPETDCWLEAEHRVTGKPKTQIARELLHALVLQKMRETEIFRGLLKANEIGGR